MEQSELYIVGGTVITGDGHTMLSNATVHVVNDKIVDIDASGNRPPLVGNDHAIRVINAERGFVIPGVVNAHAHGCTTGPVFSSAAAPLDREHAWRNADRHLAAGVTTLINVCGLGDQQDLTALDDHPMRIFISTTHFAEAFAAARIVDGAGLSGRHEALHAQEMLSGGQAVAIGEVGSGATLGGGVSSYKYVPQAVREIFGQEIDAAQAGQLIDSLLGARRELPERDEAFDGCLLKLGLIKENNSQDPKVAQLKEAIMRYAYEPVAHSLKTFEQAAALSAQTQYPAVFHTALPSVATLLEIATKPLYRDAILVAGHMNHTSIPLEDMLVYAAKLKDAGVVIDVSVLDSVSTRQLVTPKEIDALMASGLVDTLSTDYAAGHWDSMLEAIQRWWRKGIVPLPKGVEMATSRPAAIFKAAAERRGRLAPGYCADIVITEEVNIGRVRTVIIDGRVVREFDAVVPRHMDCCS